MTRFTDLRRWLTGAALAVAVGLPLWALAEAKDGATCPGPQAGACADAGGCPHADGCPGGACANGGCPHMAGHHHGGMGARHFDPKTVTQVRGTVEEVEPFGRHGHGVHLVLAVGGERLDVMVGPDFYLQQQGLALAKGDALEVKGSRVDPASAGPGLGGGAPVLVAQEITKGGKTVTLRDADGTPRWAGPNAQR